MKINLNGYEGVPEEKALLFENDSTITLECNLDLTEVMIVFSNGIEEEKVVCRDANNCEIPIPQNMLKADTVLHIGIKAFKGSKIVNSWRVRPIILNEVESGLEAHMVDSYREIASLKEQVNVLTGIVAQLQSDITMLKERINPIKDVL